MPKYNLSLVNILIVDGNWHMRKLIGTILQGFGVKNIEFAADGREALGKLAGFSADLVICEYRLGHVNGVELTRRIRRAGKKVDPFLPVIMITGHTEQNIVASARDAGISAVIAKPVSASTLYERIFYLIERPRPFVRAPKFFGPDRRTRIPLPNQRTPGRRASDRIEAAA